MKYLYKNPFERKQKGTVVILCIVCMLFVWSCHTKNEADSEVNQLLSHDQINFNLSKKAKSPQNFLLENGTLSNLLIQQTEKKF